MKHFAIRRSGHWIALFLLTDAVFLFTAWLLRPEAFRYMALFLGLFTVLALAAGLFAEVRRQKKEAAVVLRFLESPEERTEAELLARFRDSETAHALCTQFLSLQSQINEKTVGLAAYRGYIEAWVHEAKTPLSLSTLVLDNHRDELPPHVAARLQYAQHQLNEDVERILYYARLQADHPDIRFSRFLLDDCVREALAEYRPFLEERRVSVKTALEPAEVDSDRKIVLFLLSQLLGNAVKYADEKEGKLSITLCQENDKIHLKLCNNGGSVPPEDAPFLFDRGFTGSRPNRQKATGMGLYLVRKYGQKLCVDVRLLGQIPYESGFGIELIFAR